MSNDWRVINSINYMYAGNSIGVCIKDRSVDRTEMVKSKVPINYTINYAYLIAKCVGRTSAGLHVQSSITIEITSRRDNKIYDIGVSNRGPHNPNGKTVAFMYSVEENAYRNQLIGMSSETQKIQTSLVDCIEENNCFVYNWQRQYAPIVKVIKCIDIYLNTFRHMQFTDYMEAMLR